MSAILSVEHVGVRFGGLVAIADLHFDVRAGEIVSLIGPNGAGKTTAFNVMTGFLKPSQGDVRFRGTSLKGLPPHRNQGIGSRLMDVLLEYADSLGRQASLHVEPFNPAKRMYERLAFRVVETRGLYEFMVREAS